MVYTLLDLSPKMPKDLEALIRLKAEPLLKEIHYLLTSNIPDGNTSHHYQYAITLTCLSVISGFSSTFYAQKVDNRKKFIGALNKYYPWDLDPPINITPQGAANVLYNYFRNPLSHSLGLSTKPKGVKYGRAHTREENKLEEIETSNTRHGRPSLESRDDCFVLWTETLYWGIRIMFERFSNDTAEHTNVIKSINDGNHTKLHS